MQNMAQTLVNEPL